MGLGKPAVEFVEEMTEPFGWPDIDEDVLTQRATDLTTIRDQVAGVLGDWRRQQAEIFAGGSWSGTAADAGRAAVEQRIASMDKLQRHLEKAAAWYRLVASVIVQAKTTITNNLEETQEVIAAFRNDPDIDADEREAAVKAYVIAQHALNSSVVVGASAQLPPFHTWQPPPGAIPPVTAPPGAHLPAAPPTPVSITEETAYSRIVANPIPPATDPPAAIRDQLEFPSQAGIPMNPAQAEQEVPSASPPTVASPGGGQSSSGVGSPSTGAAGGSGSTANPTSGASTSTSSSGSPTTANPAATAGKPTDAAAAAGPEAGATATPAQPVMPQVPLGPPTAATPPAPAPTPTPTGPPTAPPGAPPPAAGVSSSSGVGGAGVSGGSGAAPVGAAPGPSAPSPPVPLGPPATPPPAAPTPGAAPAGPVGPGVVPASTANTAAGAPPAPVPVSAARAERDAIATASTAGALRRQAAGSNPLQLARRIGAALNVGIVDFGFFWVTGLTTDNRIVVANSYGLAYIPDDVHLPEKVHMATADESIPISDRATWATYPILALQGWAQHRNVALRAVVATEDQFADFDPGVAKIILQPDDIPDSGKMEGRNRLEVIAPEAAARLASVGELGLTELLPPAPADTNPPADESHTLWFEVAKPLMSTSTQRAVAHLEAFLTFANHAQELALHRAHTATDAVSQRAAIADWVYWQHLGVLMSDAVSSRVSV